jgi:hypothetical protein
MLELLQSYSTGTLAEVWVDVDAGVVEKRYKVGGITCTGKPNEFTRIEAIRALFENDIEWSKKLAGPYTVKTLDYGDAKDYEGFYQVQEYLGPDLMFYFVRGNLNEAFPTLVDQLEEMFKFYQQRSIFKCNHALSNLTGKDGKIKAFDFKFTEYRSMAYLGQEILSINKWLSKAGPDVKRRLMPYIISNPQSIL